ncbi:MAG TPA: fasciclin domain-containing protein [Chitinophagaceae bacterium]
MSTILQIANADRNLSILLKGLKAAELEESLNGIGPFTILAPINLAFGKLAYPDTFENLVKQGNNKERLSDILTYHVLTGKKLVRDFRDGQKLQTVNGKEVTVTVKDDEVRINGARILARDRQGSNGVVHSIDAVYLPAK